MEIYKDILGFEAIYQVSNLGNVKSLKFGKEKFISPSFNGNYFSTRLHRDGIVTTFKTHQLVAMCFLGHNPCGYKLVINHINHNKLDNNVANLEVVTQRQNANRKHLPSSSKYTGVCWNKKNKKWMASIRIKSKIKYLGSFFDETEASLAYEYALLQNCG